MLFGGQGPSGLTLGQQNYIANVKKMHRGEEG